MSDHNNVAAAIVNDKAELIERLVIGNETVWTLKGIVVGFANELQRSAHGLAAKRFGIRVLRARHLLTLHDFHELT